MDETDGEVSDLRDALPASVSKRLSDDQLRSGLDKARNRLGPDADTTAVQGAAWLLAHEPDQRREQIDHMLELAALRQRDLLQAEHLLLGAFDAEPELDDTARGTTRQEFQDDLDRAEKLLAILTARAGGTTKITEQELADAPALLIVREDHGFQTFAFDLGSYLDDHIDNHVDQ
ncbi:hypothetical protein ACFS27_12760 [Promicromonospora vindobonensis]|uniref:Uncharacterized protein n=1 Tax=Promicromonospora vindobonensis TaxID=195748 RepID=A0ABW5VT53_9MICO